MKSKILDTVADLVRISNNFSDSSPKIYKGYVSDKQKIIIDSQLREVGESMLKAFYDIHNLSFVNHPPEGGTLFPIWQVYSDKDRAYTKKHLITLHKNEKPQISLWGFSDRSGKNLDFDFDCSINPTLKRAAKHFVCTDIKFLMKLKRRLAYKSNLMSYFVVYERSLEDYKKGYVPESCSIYVYKNMLVTSVH